MQYGFYRYASYADLLWLVVEKLERDCLAQVSN